MPTLEYTHTSSSKKAQSTALVEKKWRTHTHAHLSKSRRPERKMGHNALGIDTKTWLDQKSQHSPSCQNSPGHSVSASGAKLGSRCSELGGTLLFLPSLRSSFLPCFATKTTTTSEYVSPWPPRPPRREEEEGGRWESCSFLPLLARPRFGGLRAAAGMREKGKKREGGGNGK